MLAARETKMLSAERMERMIDAPTNEGGGQDPLRNAATAT